jgi:hypothetical protein
VLEGVEFRVIKKWDKPADGYTFLHGVGLAWHKGKLYVGYSNNGGRAGNLNSAELAIIPIASLQAE